MQQILSDISLKLQEGKAKDVQELVQQALDRSIPVAHHAGPL